MESPAPGRDWADPDEEIVPLENILPTAFHFEYDSYALSETAKAAGLAERLRMSGKSVTLAGHASEEGTTEYNQSLGMHRAIAVAAYLKSYGIPWHRVAVESYGEERPATFDPHQIHLNRRVEVRFEEK